MGNLSRFGWLNPRSSLASRLTLVIVLLVTATVATVTFVTTRSVNGTLADQIGGNFEAQAGDVNDLIQVFLLGQTGQLQAMASSHYIRGSVTERNASYAGGAEETLEEIQSLDEQWMAAADEDPLVVSIVDPEANSVAHELEGFLDTFEKQSEVFVTDRHGATVAATGRLSDYYQADEEWWQAAWNDGKGAVYISDPEYDESAGVTALLIAVPLVHEGELIGVARSTLDISNLSKVIGEVTFGRTGHALLLDRSGEVLFESAGDDNGTRLTLPPMDLRQQWVQQRAGFSVARGSQGREQIFGFAHLGTAGASNDASDSESQARAAVADLGWSAVVAQQTDEAFASSDAIAESSSLAGAVVAVIAAIAALLVARAVTRPITRLATAAEAVRAGDLDTDLPRSGADEVGRLTTSFGNMTGRLRSVIRSLEGRTDELRPANEELRERNRQLLDARAQAATDALTGLSNHRAFHQRIREEASRAQETERPVGLIMLDIDDFKRVNDSQGHLAGDSILRQLAPVLAAVAPRENAYRYGGDEFAILLPGADCEKTAGIAERLRRSVERGSDGDRVTVSLGVASFPDAAASVEELIYGADVAMYWAKSAGKNRVGEWRELLTQRSDGALPWYSADRAVNAPDVVVALGAALAAKDPTTSAHTERCSWYAAKLAEELGLEEKETSVVRLASLLHDVGKLAIPDAVLFKPGPLNEEEWAQMKQHPTAALRMLAQIRSLSDATPAILHHHEHFDGSGYPDGVAGEEIPIASRILLVTDAFDAMTTDRPYRKAMPVEAAVEELKRCSGSQFDPTVVDAFLRVVSREGTPPLGWNKNVEGKGTTAAKRSRKRQQVAPR